MANTSEQQQPQHFITNLMNLPNELLDEIFKYFDDRDLLQASHVCRSFVVIAARAFERKYANRRYEMSGLRNGQRGLHRAILHKFGSKLTSLFIYKYDLINRDRHIMTLIVQNCANITKFELIDVSIDLAEFFSHAPNLTFCSLNGVIVDENCNWNVHSLPKLKHFEIRFKYELQMVSITEFLNRNGQIETLAIDTEHNLLPIIGKRLNRLKDFKIVDYGQITVADATTVATASATATNSTHSTDALVNLNALESLEIFSDDPNAMLRYIQNGCKNLKQLIIVFKNQTKLDKSILVAIGPFEQLTTLKIFYAEITMNQIKLLQSQSPHLRSLHIEMFASTELAENILWISSAFKKMINLEIQLDSVHCPNGWNYNFHRRFLVAIGSERHDLKLNLLFREHKLIISRDSIYHARDGSNPILVHWIGYEAVQSKSKVHILELNDPSMWHLFDFIDLISLDILQRTCRDMRSKIQIYMNQKYEQKIFRFLADEHWTKWFYVLKHFGIYFRRIQMRIPSSAYHEEDGVFTCVNYFCPNIVELRIKHNGLFALGPECTLPNLRTLIYDGSEYMDIGVFADCPQLERMQLYGPITMNYEALTQPNIFINLTTIKMYLHSPLAVEFFNILGANQFQQLKNLWISTFGVSMDDFEYPQLSQVISKFINLRSLHLIMPFTQFDIKLLLTKCKQIASLSILSDSVITNNSRVSYEHIRRYGLQLNQLQIYQYKNVLLEKDWEFIVSIFPNLIIKSIQIDSHGKCCSMNVITKPWLQTLAAYDL